MIALIIHGGLGLKSLTNILRGHFDGFYPIILTDRVLFFISLNDICCPK